MGNLSNRYVPFTPEEIEKDAQEAASAGSGEFWKPSPGKNLVRLIPALAKYKEKRPWLRTDQHYIEVPGGDDVSFNCPKLMRGTFPCPVCVKMNELRATGNSADYEASKPLYPRIRVYARIVDRGDMDRGVRVFAFGKTIWEEASALFDGGDFTDPEEGYDMIISKKGEKLTTKYKVTLARDSSAIGYDEWIDQAEDISLIPYARLESPDEMEAKCATIPIFGRRKRGQVQVPAETRRRATVADEATDDAGPDSSAN